MTSATESTRWERIMRERGHTPVLTDGDLEYFAYESGNHNGPRCKTCGWKCCWHCEPDPLKAIPKECSPR